VQGWHGFHIENRKLVEVLELVARSVGVEFTDGKVAGATRGSEGGVTAVHLEDGQTLAADFFVDASGFRSELLGKALAEPYISFDKSLFCDRAVVGGWERARTSRSCLHDGGDDGRGLGVADRARALREPGVRVLLGRDLGRRRAGGIPAQEPEGGQGRAGREVPLGAVPAGVGDNVCAIGNACGFVEPLEATSLMVICSQCDTLVQFLQYTALSPTPTMRKMYNHLLGKCGTRSGFPRAALQAEHDAGQRVLAAVPAETDVSAIGELLEFYEENGPMGFSRHLLRSTANNFGIEGFLVMLVGNKAPYRARHHATAAGAGDLESPPGGVRGTGAAGDGRARGAGGRAEAGVAVGSGSELESSNY
jgi:tryptophan halogenase